MNRGSKHGIDRNEWLQVARQFCARGERLPHAKLNADAVIAIRANRLGQTDKQMAEKLGVSAGSVFKARNRYTWGHIV